MSSMFCGLSEVPVNPEAAFVAVNRITCRSDYRPRFECLFCTRAKAIDRLDGFCGMQVLKPTKEDEAYLVVSFWKSEADFTAWVASPEFIEGHQRGFDDLKAAKERGEEAPMKSSFSTYSVLAR